MPEQAEAGAVERVTGLLTRCDHAQTFELALNKTYFGTPKEVNILSDLRTLLADLARMKAALERIARMPTIDVLQGGEAIRAARLALRQHEDGR